jgi:hypothetical protein
MSSALIELAQHLASAEVELRPLTKFTVPLTLEQRAAEFSRQASAEPALFLERYGRDCPVAMLEYFDTFADQYEVAFHLRLLRAAAVAPMPVQIRNRRFRKFVQLSRDGDYFSDDAMQIRDPPLFQQLIVRHMSTVERSQYEQEQVALNRGKISTAILNTHDRERSHARAGTRIEDDIDVDIDWVDRSSGMDYSDTAAMQQTASRKLDDLVCSDESELESDHDDEPPVVRSSTLAAPESLDAMCVDDEDDQPISPRLLPRSARERFGGLPRPSGDVNVEYRQAAREQLLDIMRSRFLTGQDTDWIDYSSIDNDASLDRDEGLMREAGQRGADDFNSRALQCDEEERYFDDM